MFSILVEEVLHVDYARVLHHIFTKRGLFPRYGPDSDDHDDYNSDDDENEDK